MSSGCFQFLGRTSGKKLTTTSKTNMRRVTVHLLGTRGITSFKTSAHVDIAATCNAGVDERRY
jgi:hypothetical protein